MQTRGTKKIRRLRAQIADQRAARFVRLERANPTPLAPAYSIMDDLVALATDDVDTVYGDDVESLEADAAEWADPAECPVCGGEATILGALGTRVHHRCRRCGADFSVEGGR